MLFYVISTLPEYLSATIGEAHQAETQLIPIALEVPLGKKNLLPFLEMIRIRKMGTTVRDYVHVVD